MGAFSVRRAYAGHLRHALPVLALGIGGWVLAHRLGTSDWTDLQSALRAVGPWQWTGAVGFTILSFLALGRYDALFHQRFGTGIGAKQARHAGMQAVALSQVIGFGTLTGGLVRWRALPSLSMWQATQISVAVTISFLVCLASINGGLLIFGQGATAFGAAAAVIGGLMVLGVGVGLRLATPHLTRLGLMTSDLARLWAWSALDIGAAAAVLWCLLPGGAGDVPFLTILTAYSLALGAGLISNAPGGVGAFDLTFLALVPGSDPDGVLAALLAFRVIYYVAPAAIALLALARGTTSQAASPLETLDDARAQNVLATTAPADWQLWHDGGDLVAGPNGTWFLRRCAGTVTAIGGVVGAKLQSADLIALRHHAAQMGGRALIYKCNGRQAAQARAAGWTVLRTARDALITPATWSPDRPACRQLRRKVRHAIQSGVRVERGSLVLPLHQMAHIAALWAHQSGGERGFSMGQFKPERLARQVVFLAWDQNRLLGFVTFHQRGADWTLDLVRHLPHIPDGTMHHLCATAIRAAHIAGIARVSLAAAPDVGATLRGKPLWGDTGLTQFKQSFGPIWAARYICAPTRATLIIGGATVGLAVRWPWLFGTTKRPGHRVPSPVSPDDRRSETLFFDLKPTRTHAMRHRMKPCAATPGPAAPE